MKVTRDVVVDLLPLYVAGEASPDTRALVEEFLERDNDLRRQADEARAGLVPRAGDAALGAPPPDLELRSLRRARGLLRWQRITYAWALTFSFLSLTSAFSLQDGRVHFRLLLLEYPGLFVPCLTLAAGCWLGYVLLRRRG